MLGSTLKREREKLELTQTEFARIVGLHAPVISQFETGQLTFKKSRMRRISEKLKELKAAAQAESNAGE